MSDVEVLTPDEVNSAIDQRNAPVTGNVTPAAGASAVATPPELETVKPSPDVSGQAGNEDSRLEDYKRKYVGSTEEALRLKAENEELKAQLSQPKAQTVQVPEDQVEAFKILAAAAGYAPKTEVITREDVATEKKQEALNSFIAQHPEYGKAGDPESEKQWASLVTEISEYRPAATPAEFARQLAKAHKMLESSKTDDLTRGKALGFAEANLRNQNSQGSGSFGGNSQPSQANKISPERQEVSEGFASVLPNYYAQK